MPQKKTRRIIKNTLALYFRMLLLMFINLYASRVTLDILGVNDFGIYNLVAGIIVIMGFINQAMALSVNRYIAYYIGKGDEEQTKHVFSMSVNIHILIAFLVLFCGESIGLWFVNTLLNIPSSRIFAANIVYQTSIFVFCCNIIKIPYDADIVANEDMNVYAYISLFEGVAKLGIVFLLPYVFFDKLSLYSILILIVSICTSILYYQYAVRKYKEARYHLFWSKPLLIEMSKYAGFSTFGNLATALVSQGQSVLLNIFFGPALNAVRGLSLSVNSGVCGFIQNIYTSVTPQITKSYAEGDTNYFYDLVYNSTKFSYYILFIITLPLLLEVDFILNLWLKVVPTYTSIFVKLLLINSLIFYFTTPTIIALQATGRIAKIHLLTGSINLSNLLLSYILLRFYSCPPTTLYFVQIFISFAIVLCTIIIQKEQLKIRIADYLRNTVTPAILSSVAATIIPLAFRLNYPAGWLRFIITCCLSLISCIFSFYYIGITKDFRKKIDFVIRQKIRTCFKYE